MNRERLERELFDQPVKNLQYMLGRLGQKYPYLPYVPADGEFGEATLEAVMLFQRENGLPVTGVVDLETWDAIRDSWEAAETEWEGPRSVRLFPGGVAGVAEGEEREFMIVPQAMLQVLGRCLEGIKPCEGGGCHGPVSAENVRWLQRAAGMEETGVMDLAAWEALSRLYEVFVVRRPMIESPVKTWG